MANPLGAEVFISYAQDEDSSRALAIADHLEAVGATVWIADRSIQGAQNYGPEIVAAIKACKVVAILCSDASMRSRYVAREVQIGFENSRGLLPLMLDSTPVSDEVLFWLGGANRIDVSSSVESWLPRITRALEILGVRCETSTITEPGQPEVRSTIDSPAGRNSDAATLSESQRLPSPTEPGTKSNERTVKSRVEAFVRLLRRAPHSKVLLALLAIPLGVGLALLVLPSSAGASDHDIAAAGLVTPSDLGAGWHQEAHSGVVTVTNPGALKNGETVQSTSVLRRVATPAYLVFDGATALYRTDSVAADFFNTVTDPGTLASLITQQEFPKSQDVGVQPSNGPHIGDNAAYFSVGLTATLPGTPTNVRVSGSLATVRVHRAVTTFGFYAVDPAKSLTSSEVLTIVRHVVERVSRAESA